MGEERDFACALTRRPAQATKDFKMRSGLCKEVIFVVLLAVSTRAAEPANRAGEAALRNWPSWRGPLASGAAPHPTPPIRWSETNNVRWKVPMPGKAHSSPIVFGEQVFLLSAVPVGEAQKPVYDTAPGTHDGVP